MLIRKLLLPLMDRTSYKDATFKISQVLFSIVFFFYHFPVGLL